MDVERVVVRIMADATDYTRLMNQVETRMVGLAQRAASMAAGGGFMGALVGSVAGTGLAGALAAIQVPVHMLSTSLGSVVSFTSEAATAAVQLGVNYERSALAFEVMTGSVAKGKQLLTDIRQLGVTSPYNSKDLREQTQILIGMGVASDQVINVLGRLGDIAGGDKDKLDRLALAFGQVIAAGKFMGTELRQFTEAGVGAEDFAKASGMTGFQLRNLMEQGRADLNIMIRGINSLTSPGGRFAGLSQRASQETVGGQYSNLMERFQNLGEDLSTALFKRFDVAGVLDRLQNQFANMDVGKITRWLGDAGDYAVDFGKKAVTWFGEAWTAAKPLVAGMGAIGKGFLDVGNRIFGTDWKDIQKTTLEFSKTFVVGFLEMTKVALELGLALAMVGAEIYSLKDSWLAKGLMMPVNAGKVVVAGIEKVLPGSTTGTVRTRDEIGEGFRDALERLKKFDPSKFGDWVDKGVKMIDDAERQVKGVFNPAVQGQNTGVPGGFEMNPFKDKVEEAQRILEANRNNSDAASLDDTIRNNAFAKITYAERNLTEAMNNSAEWERQHAQAVAGVVGATNKTTDALIGLMPNMSGGALDVMKKLDKASEVGFDPYEKFLTQVKDIQEARRGFVKDGQWMGISEVQKQQGIAQAFQDLSKTVTKLENTEARMPELAMAGAQKARDTINTASANAVKEPLQNIEEILREARQIHEDTKTEVTRTADGVEAILKKPGPVAGGVK